MPELRAEFDRFAPILAKFKNLRNDCNYEALLVAHEVNHIRVTPDFDNLVKCADEASKAAVELAVAAYLGHVRSDPCFEAHRSQFHAAHNNYVSSRFNHSLRRKFNGSSTARTELLRLSGLLAWPQGPAANDTDQFLEPIMYDTFGEKQGLMQRWRDDITALQQALLAT